MLPAACEYARVWRPDSVDLVDRMAADLMMGGLRMEAAACEGKVADEPRSEVELVRGRESEIRELRPTQELDCSCQTTMK